MASFVGRVASWLANEVIVKTLSESRAFQRFALKTDAAISKAQGSVKEKAEEVLKKGMEHPELKQHITKVRPPVASPLVSSRGRPRRGPSKS